MLEFEMSGFFSEIQEGSEEQIRLAEKRRRDLMNDLVQKAEKSRFPGQLTSVVYTAGVSDGTRSFYKGNSEDEGFIVAVPVCMAARHLSGLTSAEEILGMSSGSVVHSVLLAFR